MQINLRDQEENHTSLFNVQMLHKDVMNLSPFATIFIKVIEHNSLKLKTKKEIKKNSK